MYVCNFPNYRFMFTIVPGVRMFRKTWNPLVLSEQLQSSHRASLFIYKETTNLPTANIDFRNEHWTFVWPSVKIYHLSGFSPNIIFYHRSSKEQETQRYQVHISHGISKTPQAFCLDWSQSGLGTVQCCSWGIQRQRGRFADLLVSSGSLGVGEHLCRRDTRRCFRVQVSSLSAPLYSLHPVWGSQ